MSNSSKNNNSNNVLIYIIFGVIGSTKELSESLSNIFSVDIKKNPNSLIERISKISNINKENIKINNNDFIHTSSGTWTFISSYIDTLGIKKFIPNGAYDYFSTDFYNKNKTIINRHLENINKLEQENNYNKIFIYGFSYGGGLANCIAEKLNNESIATKIHISTFGSIYIPSDKGESTQSNIDIINYLAIGDIAEQTTQIQESYNSLNKNNNSNIQKFSFIFRLQKINIRYIRDNKIINFCNCAVNNTQTQLNIENVQRCKCIKQKKNSVINFKIHNSSYGGLIFCLVKYKTNLLPGKINNKNITITNCSQNIIMRAEKQIYNIITNPNFNNNNDVYFLDKLNIILRTLCTDNNDDDKFICNSILLLILEKIFIFKEIKNEELKKIINKISKNVIVSEEIKAIQKFGR